MRRQQKNPNPNKCTLEPIQLYVPPLRLEDSHHMREVCSKRVMNVDGRGRRICVRSPAKSGAVDELVIGWKYDDEQEAEHGVPEHEEEGVPPQSVHELHPDRWR